MCKTRKHSIDIDRLCGSLPSDYDLMTRDFEIPKYKKHETSFCSLIDAKKETKKFVRFADSLGLDLVSIKVINKENNVVSHNDTTMFHTDNNEIKQPLKVSFNQKHYLVLIPCFTLSKYFYNDSTQTLNCKLIDYLFDNENKILKFLIRVKNISYEKKVFIRFSINNWKSFQDIGAIYTNSTNLRVKPNVNLSIGNNQYNNFNCILSINNYLSKNVTDTDGVFKIEYAVCYKSNENYYWDNNNGNNYIFQCFYPKNQFN